MERDIDVLVENNIEIVDKISDMISQINTYIADIEKMNLDDILGSKASIESYIKASYDKTNKFMLSFNTINSSIYTYNSEYYEANKELLGRITSWLWGFDSIYIDSSFRYELSQYRGRFASKLNVFDAFVIINEQITPKGIKLAKDFKTDEGYAVYCIDFINRQFNILYPLRHNLENRYKALAYICSLMSTKS